MISTASIILLALIEAAAQSYHPLIFTSGTTIVIHKSPNEIVVGADSLLVRRSGTLAVPLSECKITRVGNDFFAIAGNIREQVKGFDAGKIAAEAVGSSDKAAEKVKAFEESIRPPLTELLRIVKSNTPEYFDKLFRDKIVLAVAFFGIEEGNLYLYVRTYIAAVYNTNDVEVGFENKTDCLADCAQTFAFGENAAIKEFIDTNPKYRAASTVEFVRQFVQLEINQRLEYVGPPIDIVRLNTNAANWVQVKPECKCFRKSLWLCRFFACIDCHRVWQTFRNRQAHKEQSTSNTATKSNQTIRGLLILVSRLTITKQL